MWLQWPDVNHLAGLDRVQSLSAGWQERQQVLHAIRLRAQDDDRKSPPGHILLMPDMAIAGEHYIPSALGKGKELTVLLRPKTCLSDGLALVT